MFNYYLIDDWLYSMEVIFNQKTKDIINYDKNTLGVETTNTRKECGI